MTPEYKARRLVAKYLMLTNDFSDAKKAAIIAVNLLFEEDYIENLQYWEEVQKEIKLLGS